MRWERLFDELEGHAEHAHTEERDALVADLREGEWAARSWIDGLQDAPAAELEVADVGVLHGRVRLANALLIHLESASADHVISTHAVRWTRGVTRGPGLVPGSVAARLGWGHLLREMQADDDLVRLALVGGLVIEGRINAVGSDFVRVNSRSGTDRDVPTRVILVATTVREA
jgi:hypothetical protein